MGEKGKGAVNNIIERICNGTTNDKTFLPAGKLQGNHSEQTPAVPNQMFESFLSFPPASRGRLHSPTGTSPARKHTGTFRTKECCVFARSKADEKEHSLSSAGRINEQSTESQRGGTVRYHEDSITSHISSCFRI